MKNIETIGLFKKILQPAFIITIATCVGYLWGWHYIDGYLERFGLNHDSFEFSLTYYLNQSFFISIFLAMILFFSIGRKKDSQLTIPQAFQQNSIILLFLGIGLSMAFKDFPSPNAIMILLNSLILLIYFVRLSCKKKTIISVIENEGSPIVFLLAFLLMILLGLLISRDFGEEHARRTISGALNNLSSISFVSDNPSITDLNKKELNLIFYHNSNYYLVEKEQPAPKFPKIFIVPDKNIEYVICKKFN
ncbi:MAG: hypothetical protein WC532_05410 [Candidatus Omnitrophota bacterium]